MRWLLPQAAYHLQAKAGLVAQMCVFCTQVRSLQAMAGWRSGMRLSLQWHSGVQLAEHGVAGPDGDAPCSKSSNDSSPARVHMLYQSPQR